MFVIQINVLKPKIQYLNSVYAMLHLSWFKKNSLDIEKLPQDVLSLSKFPHRFFI